MPNRSISPSLTMARPPPPPSSAGWKITTAVPSKLRVSARYFAAQQHGGMTVMAAGVHQARRPRGVGHATGLLDRQRIHVGAQADDPLRARLAAVDHTHHA